jgi:hypothetical protein
MRLPRVSIAGVMLVVAIAALDIAVARAVLMANPQAVAWAAFMPNPIVVTGGALPCIALQWAAFSVIRGRGRARAFWLGFLAFGSVITAAFLWAMLFPRIYAVARARTFVKAPGSVLFPLWMSYDRLVWDRIGRLLFDFNTSPATFVATAARVVFQALVWSTPQLLVALIGGLIAWWLFGVRRAGPRTESLDAAGPSWQPSSYSGH